MIISLDIDPATLPTAQQKGISRSGHVYTKAKVRNARHFLLGAIQAATGNRREGPPDGAWEVHVAYFYRPKSFPRRLWGMPKTTRPDCDNLTKLILDVLGELGTFFADDAQVFRLSQEKRYVDTPAVRPGIEIEVVRHG